MDPKAVTRLITLLLLVACTRQPDSRDTLAELTILCTAYKHAAHAARADTITGEFRQWHQQAGKLCTDVEKRSLELP